MDRLLIFEFRNLIRSKILYVSSFLALLVFFANHSVIRAIGLEGSMGGNAYSYSLSAPGSSMFLILCAIVIAVRVCYDYENNIVKNVFAKGYSKKEVYTSKLIMTLAAGSIAFFALCIIGFVYGACTVGVPDVGLGEYLMSLVTLYIICMAELSLFTFVASFIQKSGFTVATLLIGPTIISIVLSIADFCINGDLPFKLAPLWIGYAYDQVAGFHAGYSDLFMFVGQAVIYLIISTVLGLLLSERDY